MLRICVVLVFVALALADECVDFASFNIQVLGQTKVKKPDVMASLTEVGLWIKEILM